MTHAGCGLKLCSVTINSGNILGHVPPPPDLSTKHCLDITSFGNALLLYIEMTDAGCGLKLCTFTKNRST